VSVRDAMSDGNGEIASILKDLSAKFDALRDDVDRLKGERRRSGGSGSQPDEPSRRSRSRSRRNARDDVSTSRSRSRSERREWSHTSRRRDESDDGRNWGRRMEASSDEENDRLSAIYKSQPQFGPDSDDDQELIEVSEETAKFLQEKCTQGVPNEARLRARKRYPLPKVPATKTPQLDSFLRPEVSISTKSADKELARVQSFVLDAMAPLTFLLEADKGEPPSWEEVRRAAGTAAELVGNASARISRLRREKVTGDLNKALLPVAKEDSNFKEAPPSLFGTEFAKTTLTRSRL